MGLPQQEAHVQDVRTPDDLLQVRRQDREEGVHRGPASGEPGDLLRVRERGGEFRRKVPLEHQRGQLHVNKQTKKYVGSSELNVRELDLHSRYIYLCTLLLQASHPFLRPLWNDFKCKYIHTSD